ncbi:MAG: hypothetical protein K2W95_14910 [Candidatus Obscuribacterales bacterium]|nr:hypothetical protein [Candidatus Obscuribacterales bacterium]
MGELRQPESKNNQTENSSGLERASDRLFDQLLSGDFNVRRNARPLMTEALQLNTMTFQDEEQKRELSLRTNLFSLATRMEWQGPDLSASLSFQPASGWNNPFRRPTYDFIAQSTDRSTMLSINSKDGAAPSISFGHTQDRLSLNYLRNADANVLTFTTQQGTTVPVKFDLGHDFRKQQFKLGLTGQLMPQSEFGVGASLGQRNYDLNFFLKIGAKSND